MLPSGTPGCTVSAMTRNKMLNKFDFEHCLCTACIAHTTGTTCTAGQLGASTTQIKHIFMHSMQSMHSRSTGGVCLLREQGGSPGDCLAACQPADGAGCCHCRVGGPHPHLPRFHHQPRQMLQSHVMHIMDLLHCLKLIHTSTAHVMYELACELSIAQIF